MELGLVDRIGRIQDAIDCANQIVKKTDYRLKEYPEPKSLIELLLGNYKKSMRVKAVKEELGEDGFKTYMTLQKLKNMIGITQARIPADLDIQ